MPKSKFDLQQARRLSFVDEHLYWTGEIRRRQIKEAFGISEDTAQRDLRTYRRGWVPQRTSALLDFRRLYPQVRTLKIAVPIVRT